MELKTELETGSETRFAQAHADEIRMNGYTVLKNAIPRERLESMRPRFETLLAAKRAAEPSNRGANRFQMHLPFEMPFSDTDLYENPRAMPIIDNLLGKDVICTYFASDTPYPGSEYQKVHLDCRLPFPEDSYGVPVYSVVLNVTLEDYSEENGPLEVWPGGTHLIAKPVDLERMAAIMPSERLMLKVGDLLLRDARMWHRGTPNRSDRSRPNLALVYSRGWFRFESHPYRIKIPRATFTEFSDRTRAMFRYCAILEPDGAISDVTL